MTAFAAVFVSLMPAPSRPWIRSSGLAIIAARFVLTAQPKLELLRFSTLGSDGRLQLGQLGTIARRRLTTTLTVPGWTIPAVTGAPAETVIPYCPAMAATWPRAASANGPST